MLELIVLLCNLLVAICCLCLLWEQMMCKWLRQSGTFQTALAEPLCSRCEIRSDKCRENNASRAAIYSSNMSVCGMAKVWIEFGVSGVVCR